MKAKCYENPTEAFFDHICLQVDENQKVIGCSIDGVLVKMTDRSIYALLAAMNYLENVSKEITDVCILCNVNPLIIENYCQSCYYERKDDRTP